MLAKNYLRCLPVLLLLATTALLVSCTATTSTSQPASSSLPASAVALPTASSTVEATSAAMQPRTPVSRSPLSNATAAEVGQFALAQAQSYQQAGTTAQVVLAQPTTIDQVAALGLGQLNFASIETPPLMLIILKGSYNVANILPGASPPSDTPDYVSYLVYVYDLWAGAPTLITYSKHGGMLRRVLNDPSLPDDSDSSPAVPP